jgi:hypothetical protein
MPGRGTMLTVESAFCAEMKLLWPTEVQSTVSGPDERWVKPEAGYPKAAVLMTDFAARAGVGPGRVRRVTQGTPGTEVRARGRYQFVLEVRLATDNAAEELLTLCDEFAQYFHQGVCFGPSGDTKAFQVNGVMEGTRVRSQRGAPRVTEMVMRIPVTGPFEVSAEKYEIEEVEVEVEVEEGTEIVVVQEEGD